MSASEELLEGYHVGLNQYISSRKWLSLSANEIIERSIRTLPYEYDFKSGFNSQALLFYRALCLLMVLVISIVLIPVILIFFVWAHYKKNKIVSSAARVLFIRNDLSIKRFISLVDYDDRFNYSILYDDYLGLDIDIEYKSKIALSGYTPFNFCYYYCSLIQEFMACAIDYYSNAPEKKLADFVGIAVRLPHFILVKVSLEQFCKSNEIDELSSFEMISRYSSMLNQVVDKYDIDSSIGYPHGLEYDICYPNGVFGKHVYVTSKDVLSKFLVKYPLKEFEYDYNLINALFYKKIRFKTPRRFVYFTDARNPNLDSHNLNELKKLVENVKLHPADKKAYYSQLKLTYLDDFDEALAYGKVIVRSSTVVFEALISGCETYCLCTNLKEIYLAKYLYPTINSSTTHKILSLDSFTKERGNV